MLLLSLLAVVAAAPPSFAAAKEGAMPLDRPANSVKVLVGACEVVEGGVSGECLENTKAMKAKVEGKRVVLDLGAGHDKLLSFAGMTGKGTRFAWAPLYDVGNGLALTVGKPSKISDAGNVVMNKRPIDGTSPPDLMEMDFTRLATTGQLGIEIVGKFGKPWSMPDKKGGSVKGLTFEVEALRLYNGRTGATVFESTQSLK